MYCYGNLLLCLYTFDLTFSIRLTSQSARGKASKSSATAAIEDESMDDSQQLQEQAAQALELLQECRKRRKALAEEIRTLKKRVKALTLKLPKLEMEIEGCDTTREELTKRIPDLRAESEMSSDDAKKVEGLKKKVEKCKADMASCALLASKLEADVARLQKAILDAGGTKLKKQQAACDKALAKLDSAEKALNTAKVAITSSSKAAKKASDAKETAETDLEKCRKLLEEKQTEFKALEEDALKVMQAYEEVKAVEAEKRLALEAVSKECEELKKSTSEIKCIEIDLLGKVDAFDKQISECQRRINHFEQEISNLRAAEEEDDDFDESDDESEDEAEDKEGGKNQEDNDGDIDMAETDEEVTPEESAEVYQRKRQEAEPRFPLFRFLHSSSTTSMKSKRTLLFSRENIILLPRMPTWVLSPSIARRKRTILPECLISMRFRRNETLLARSTKSSEGCVLINSWMDSARSLSS